MPIGLQNLAYAVTLSSPATAETLARLHAEVERVCPILNLLTTPQPISGSVVNVADADLVAAS